MVVSRRPRDSAVSVLRSPVPRRRRVLGRGQQRCPGRRGHPSRRTAAWPARRSRLRVGPRCSRSAGRWALDPATGGLQPVQVPRQWLGRLSEITLQLGHSPGGVVHLRYRQAEPVPQAPEPFAAGPGDRLLQLPPVDGNGRAGGGARRGCHIRCRQMAWAFIWCRRIPVHCGLLSGLAGFAGLPAWYRRLMTSAGLGSRLASLSRAAEVFTTHDRPQDSPQDCPQESAGPALRCWLRGVGAGPGRLLLAFRPRLR